MGKNLPLIGFHFRNGRILIWWARLCVEVFAEYIVSIAVSGDENTFT